MDRDPVMIWNGDLHGGLLATLMDRNEGQARADLFVTFATRIPATLDPTQ